MSITYEDEARCLHCWEQPSYHQNTVLRQAISQSYGSKKGFQKISLKKHESQSNKQKHQHQRNSTQHHTCLHPLESTTHHSQELSTPMKPKPADCRLQLTGDNLRVKKSLSIKQKENERRTLLEEGVQGVERAQQVCGTARFVQPLQLTQTTKIGRQLMEQQLSKTRKMIPRSQHNLFQLSKMKHSSVSIFGPEEKTRVEESMIMIDFFNPSSYIEGKLLK